MSNISFENKTGSVIFKKILQDAVTDIKKKTGIIDVGIEWIIFDEKDHLEWNFLNKNTPSFVYKNSYKYGFCYVDIKQIWISTSAIMTNYITDFIQKPPMVLSKQNEEGIFLVNVILDELAHIETKKTHGNKEYDSTLKRYFLAYYRQNSFCKIDELWKCIWKH